MLYASAITPRNSKLKTRNSKLALSSWLLALGLLLTGLGGGFAPWIWHKNVALQLTGPGLAEFVKFLPEIKTGEIKIERLYFLLPLFLAMLALPLFAANKKLALPIWLRWALRLAVIPLALTSLSPVWTPAILIAPEFRLQTMLAAVAIGLGIIAPLLKNLPLKILIILLSAGGIAAVILPGWQFSLVQDPMGDAYHNPVSLDWGWWLTVVGMALSIIGGVFAAFTIPNSSTLL